MKAEHRKELRANPVVERLGQLWNDYKIKPTTSTLIFWGAVVLIVAAIVGWRLYANYSTQRMGAAWMGVADATNADDLAKVAADDPGTPPALAARFEEARAKLRQGLDKLTAPDEKDRTEAREKVHNAAELYTSLVGEADDRFPLLKEEALMGAAKAHESLGELDAALKNYRDLAGLKASSDLVRQAKEAVTQLEDPDTRAKIQAFYDQLKQPAGTK